MSYVLPLKPHLKLLMHISLQKVNDEIALPLCHLINKIFLTNIVPKQFKLAVVTPIYKRVMANIQHTALAKILRKQGNNCISKQRFGFREGLSTNDAITKLTREVTNFWKKVNPQCVCSWILPRHLTLLVIVRCWSHKLLTTNYDKTFCVPFSNTARCLPQYQQKAR
nr:unnamed protein product [Callosobruchus chinensis]